MVFKHSSSPSDLIASSNRRSWSVMGFFVRASISSKKTFLGGLCWWFRLLDSNGFVICTNGSDRPPPLSCIHGPTRGLNDWALKAMQYLLLRCRSSMPISMQKIDENGVARIVDYSLSCTLANDSLVNYSRTGGRGQIKAKLAV